MPVAQQDQWERDSWQRDQGQGVLGRGDRGPGDAPGADSAAIARLEAALARIAAAAGRQQDQLRVAELTAQTAQYELETLLHDRQAEARARELGESVAHRLDALIAAVQEALGEAPSPAADADTNPD